MLHDIIYWILGILFDCLMVRHILIEISLLYVTVQWRGESEKLHPTVPKTGSKIDPTRAPPTTPHGRFENAFPVWRENFNAASNLRSKWSDCVPTFGGNLGCY